MTVEQTAPVVDQPASAPRPAKHIFGLRQGAGDNYPVFRDDYEARLPEDPYCEETAPNARVWRVYEEETAVFDATMVEQHRDGLDVMLVFVSFFRLFTLLLG